MTADIEKWANTLSVIYSNFTKPVLDIILFSRKLAEHMGWRGPSYVVIWYILSGYLLRVLSPPFGRLTAIAQKLEGQYRACHTDLQHQAEEIAFYKGHIWEKERIKESFNRMISHAVGIMNKRLYMNTFDGMLVRYGAHLVGYSVLGLPVFGTGREEYL
jgi:ATP-binding cassette subfamily D (ALD) protein 3